METKLIESVEKLINKIIDKEINTENVKLLGMLVDIHKDIKNEEYWKEKLSMRYRNYNYDSRNYSRSGRNRNYRGEDSINDMYDSYNDYYDSRNYGHKEDSTRSLKRMLDCIEDFMCMLVEDASSDEEIMMIQKTAKKISEM